MSVRQALHKKYKLLSANIPLKQLIKPWLANDRTAFGLVGYVRAQPGVCVCVCALHVCVCGGGRVCALRVMCDV